ncbi:hypothetical protein EDB80DRAFT_529406, partial [Ilyonectria destructans]
PKLGAFNAEFQFEGLLFGPGSTINPNALHYTPQCMTFAPSMKKMPSSQTLDVDLNGW